MSSKLSKKDGGGVEAKASSVKEEGAKVAGASAKLKEPPRDAQVVRELKDLYYNKLLPIEKKYFFHELHHREILDAELGSKPTVLLLGQYSTGKTSFIKQLIGAEYPGMHIGPEPTTDKFVAVVHGETGKYIKGNALVAVKDLPFQGLHEFGETFLNKCEAAVVDAPLLKDVYIIDTPGVLSGEKQRLSRGYEFAKVTRWFAERSDLILLMFDAYKLDISDEFKVVIEGLHKYEDKVHCILNKADQLDTESLMRVYGALLWSMGKIFRGAEVTRIYVGSFRDGQSEKPEMQALFDKDKNVLMGHLKNLPTQCGMRKVNEMVKRISLNRINLLILGHLRSKMPYLSFAAEATKKKLISDLQEIYLEVSRLYNIDINSFPNVDEMRAKLQARDFYLFPRIDYKDLDLLDQLIKKEIPRIVQYVAGVEDEAVDSERNSVPFDREVELSQKILQERSTSERYRQSTFKLILGLGIVIAILIIVVSVIVFDKDGKVLRFLESLVPGKTSPSLSTAEDMQHTVLNAVKNNIQKEIKHAVSSGPVPTAEGGEEL